MKRRAYEKCSVFLLTLSIISFPGIGVPGSCKRLTREYSPISLASQSQTMMESKKQNLEIANNLLRRKGVPFDPEVLLQDNWQSAFGSRLYPDA